MTLAARHAPQDIIDQLFKTGRFTSGRALSDWRTKGLLPKLKREGKAQSRGVVQYWDEPDILERATIVHDALSINRRTYYAQWVLWFCGFSIPPATIRKIWTGLLESARIKRKAEPGNIPADKYTSEIEQLSNRIKRGHKLESLVAYPIAREIILAANEHPKIRIDRYEFSELLVACSRLVKERTIPGKNDISVSGAFLSEMQRFERSYISLQAIRDLLNSSSDAEFVRAQEYLRCLGSALRAMGTAQGLTPQLENEILKLRTQFASSFTPPIFRLILMVIRSGQEHQLKLSLPLLVKLRDRISGWSAKGQEDAQSWALFRQLFNIWKDLDYRKLYNLA
jgi:hypothetical protein